MSDTQLSIVAKLQTKEFVSGIKKMQGQLSSFSTKANQLGGTLTRNLSVPLAALGAAAIKTAADMEALETSFVSLTGSAANAAVAMQQLTDFTAKTPFQLEQVAGAARQLLAAGSEMGELNSQLQFLGDIAATTGQPINEIAAIFAKVNAKGKVELENLNQLAERGIPIFTALSEATGLLPSELGAGAVSVEQFNETLKDFARDGGFAEGAMARLSKTTNGQLSTAIDNVKIAAAELGKSFLPTVNAILEKVIELAKAFSRLDKGTKDTVAKLGVGLASLGPALRVVGTATKGLGKGLDLIAGKGKGFSKLFKLIRGINPVLALMLSGVVALGKNIYNTYKSQRAWNASAEVGKKIQEDVISLTSDRAAQAETLIGVLQRGNLTNKETEEAMEALKTISNEYFGDLKIGEGFIEDSTDALERYKQKLNEVARATALTELLTDLQRQKIELEFSPEAASVDELKTALQEAFSTEEIDRFLAGRQFSAFDVASELFNPGEAVAEDLFFQRVEEYLQIQGILSGFNQEIIDQLKERLKLEGKIAEVQSRIETGGGINTGNDSDETQIAGGKYEKAKTVRIDVDLDTENPIDEALKRAGLDSAKLKQLSATFSSLLADAITDGDVSQVEYWVAQLQEIESRLKLIDSLEVTVPESPENADEVISSWENLGKDMANAIQQQLANGLADLGTAIGDALSGASDFSFLTFLGDMLITLGKVAIQAGIAMKAIKNLFKDPATAILAGTAAIAIGTIAKNQAEAAVPAFAEGGAVLGPTLALVGEKPGSRGEAIIPFEKMGQFIGQVLPDDFAAGGPVEVYGKIRGRDIELSGRRGGQDRARRF